MTSMTYKLPSMSLLKSLLISFLMVASAITAILLTPNLLSLKDTPDFEKLIPKEFGDWKVVPDPYAQVSLTANTNDQINLLYDQVLMRTYVNSKGDQVMLALAYAREQKQDVKIHRPEVCYVAQGFQLLKQESRVINIIKSTVPVQMQRLLMQNQSRYEAVSYWIRIGNYYPANGYEARWEILKEGMRGKVLDGILVRASTAIAGEENPNVAYDKQEEFLKTLSIEISNKNPNLLIAS